MTEIKLTVTLVRERDQWSAQMHERDLAAQGDTPSAALHALGEVVQGTMLLGVWDATPPAPAEAEAALRDHFAMVALQGILAQGRRVGDYTGTLYAVRDAYAVADAMLAQRNATPPVEGA